MNTLLVTFIMITHVKSYDGQTKWMYLIDDDDLLEKYNILFGINSVLILKKNLIANLSLIKKNLKTKTKSHGDEVTDF